MAKLNAHRILANELGAGGRANQLLFTDQNRVYIGGNDGVPQEINYLRNSEALNYVSMVPDARILPNTSAIDFNDIKSVGIFRTDVNAVNAPQSGNTWALINLYASETNSPQIAIPSGGSGAGNNLFFRHRQGNPFRRVWSDFDFNISDYITKWEAWDADLTVNGNMGVGVAPSASARVNVGINSANDAILANFQNTSTSANTTSTVILSTSGDGSLRGRAYLRAGDDGNNNGYLVFGTRLNGGIFNERMRILSNGNIGFGVADPTARADINGNIRVRSLGTDAGDFVTASATGVLSRRTAAQVLSDIGAVSKWEAWNSDLTVTGNATINGNLYVRGTEFIANTETVEIEDNLALINAGEVGNGITAGFAGWEIDRGQSDNFFFGFAETPGYFQVGKAGNLQTVATREDAPVANGLAIWNNTLNRFDTQTIGQLDLATRQWVYDEVPAHVRAITDDQISHWNDAYSWGNHAAAGYAATSQLDDYVSITNDEAVLGTKVFFQVQNVVFDVNQLTLDLTASVGGNIYRLKNDAESSVLIDLPTPSEWTGEILVVVDLLTHTQDGIALDVEEINGDVLKDTKLNFLLLPGLSYLVRLVSCGEFWHVTYTEHTI